MEKWNSWSTDVLKKLYVETDVPSDGLIADETMMASFTNNLNKLIEGDVEFTAEEVAKELLRVRKSGKLPRIRQ